MPPQSARAGFAMERIAAGEDPNAVRLAGRWKSVSIFKTHIDVVTASQVFFHDAGLQWLKDIMHLTFPQLELYFSAELFRRERHAAKRVGKEASLTCLPASGHGVARRN
eukprot:TRINITY_DN46597_c0_g1_i1.p1 TRINITY_DN46597_c0_g1~~TRINITY_DN46597_c0_g1_i1.p1  ORF type:complete len:109 (-),score=17.33 TRINITY_DN46597_c0_g1_i1:30-356(-)